MSAQTGLYQHVCEQIEATVRAGVPKASRTRLRLLGTGLLAAKSVIVSQIAGQLEQLGLTRAILEESVERRVRRTLNDEHLRAETCYAPVVQQMLDWTPVTHGGEPLILIVDESSKADEVHLFRVSLPYRGGALPLAWATWV